MRIAVLKGIRTVFSYALGKVGLRASHGARIGVSTDTNVGGS